MNAPVKRAAGLNCGTAIGLVLAYEAGNATGWAFGMALVPFHLGGIVEMTAYFCGYVVYPVAGYFGWKALRRSLAGARGALWSSLLGRFVIGRIAGSVVYAALLKPAWLVSGSFMSMALHFGLLIVAPPLAVPLALASIGGLYAMTGWLAWVSRRRVKIFIGKATRPLRRLWRSLPMGNGGSSRFAGLLEEWSHPWKPGRILLGASMYDRHWLVGIEDDRHFMTIATNRAGKGRDAIIPNILGYPATGSIVNIDPKGQNCAVTAARREALGQTVVALDPAHMLDKLGLAHFRKRFNPLAGLDPAAMDYAERMNVIVDAMIVREGRQHVFFDNAGMTVIAGCNDLAVKRGDPARCTLAAVRDMLTDPNGPPVDEMAAAGGLARAAAALLSQDNPETVANVMMTVLAQTKWLELPGVRDMLSGSDFDLSHLNAGNLSLYLICPPQYLHEMRQFLRLFVATTLAACMESPKGEHATLFVLDEFYALGRLEIMAKAMGIAAGYGVKLWPVLQNLSQLQELYPENFQSFLANSGQTQVFATNDPDTAEYFSRKLGHAMRWVKRTAQDGSVEMEPGRANFVRDSVELARTTSRESGLQLVFTEGGDPFLLRRMHYDQMFPRGTYAPDPYEPDRRVSLRDILTKLRTVFREIRSWVEV